MGKAIHFQIDGKEYRSLSEAAKELGCSPVFIRQAMNEADGDQEAFERKVKNYKQAKFPVEVDGYHFSSLSETERATGISARLLRRMKLESKDDKEFSDKVKEEAEGFYALGNWYWSIREASDKLGIEESEMDSIFNRYSFSQKEMDRQLANLVGNEY